MEEKAQYKHTQKLYKVIRQGHKFGDIPYEGYHHYYHATMRQGL